MTIFTNFMRADGFGAQFQSVLWGYLFAKLTNNDFVYSDIEHMDLITNTGNIKDTENENTLEEVIEYIGFKKYCRHRNTVSDEITTLSLDHFREFIESNIDFVCNSNIFKSYKSFFYLNKINRFDKKYINIAIHIRTLGNFEKENNRFRDGTHNVPYTYFLNIMNTIRNKYSGKQSKIPPYLNIMNRIRNKNPDKQLKFHIYSQGDKAMFSEFVAKDTVLHLNEKVLDTFTDLVFADILVTTRSSFSYLAALLSNNEIYYLWFWHPPLKHWNKLSI